MSSHYTGTAKAFHWLTALAVIGLLALGHFMTSLDLSPLKLQLYSWHKWVGITVFVLTALRLVWRLTHHPPPLPPAMAPHLKLAAHAGHWGLYGLLFAMPLVGWLYSSAAGFPVVLFGVLPLPDMVAASKPLADTLGYMHWIGGWAMLFLLLGHAGAAIWHHTVKHDDTLTRMLPRRSGVAAVAGGLFIFVAAVPEPAHANGWTVDPQTSTFGFTARQVNVPITGSFKDFKTEIAFDEAEPEAATVSVIIEAASIATGNAQADQLLPGPEWFDAAAHPQAVFTANAFKPGADNTYTLAGELTLKGTTLPVPVTATITVSDADGNPAMLTAVAQGSATVSRTAFKIGEGQWADTNTIADEVEITFTFKATRAK